MVLRLKSTPTRFPTNSLYTPMDNTPRGALSVVFYRTKVLRLKPEGSLGREQGRPFGT